MIAWLKGTPICSSTKLILKVQDVGYSVEVGVQVLDRLRHLDQAELFIHTHVREDQLALFGFQDQSSLTLFELLLQVSGVGPRTALVIVDRGPDQVVKAVQTADLSYFKTIPRVGTKLAQKIIIELKTKLGGVQELSLGPTSTQQTEVVQALESMGFATSDAFAVLPQLPQNETDVAKLLKQAMKLIGSQNHVK